MTTQAGEGESATEGRPMTSEECAALMTVESLDSARTQNTAAAGDLNGMG